MSEIFWTNSWHFADKKILETHGWSIPRRTGQNQAGSYKALFHSNAMLWWSGSFDYLDAIWFLMVTCSTVGYGDVSPKTVLGKVAVMFFLCSKFHFFRFTCYTARIMWLCWGCSHNNNVQMGYFASRKKTSLTNPEVDLVSVRLLVNFQFSTCEVFQIKTYIKVNWSENFVGIN